MNNLFVEQLESPPPGSVGSAAGTLSSQDRYESIPEFTNNQYPYVARSLQQRDGISQNIERNELENRLMPILYQIQDLKARQEEDQLQLLEIIKDTRNVENIQSLQKERTDEFEVQFINKIKDLQLYQKNLNSIIKKQISPDIERLNKLTINKNLSQNAGNDTDEQLQSKGNISCALNLQSIQDQLTIYEQRLENQENRVDDLNQQQSQNADIIHTLLKNQQINYSDVQKAIKAQSQEDRKKHQQSIENLKKLISNVKKQNEFHSSNIDNLQSQIGNQIQINANLGTHQANLERVEKNLIEQEQAFQDQRQQQDKQIKELQEKLLRCEKQNEIKAKRANEEFSNKLHSLTYKINTLQEQNKNQSASIDKQIQKLIQKQLEENKRKEKENLDSTIQKLEEQFAKKFEELNNELVGQQESQNEQFERILHQHQSRIDQLQTLQQQANQSIQQNNIIDSRANNNSIDNAHSVIKREEHNESLQCLKIELQGYTQDQNDVLKESILNQVHSIVQAQLTAQQNQIASNQERQAVQQGRQPVQQVINAQNNQQNQEMNVERIESRVIHQQNQQRQRQQQNQIDEENENMFVRSHQSDDMISASIRRVAATEIQEEDHPHIRAMQDSHFEQIEGFEGLNYSNDRLHQSQINQQNQRNLLDNQQQLHESENLDINLGASGELMEAPVDQSNEPNWHQMQNLQRAVQDLQAQLNRYERRQQTGQDLLQGFEQIQMTLVQLEQRVVSDENQLAQNLAQISAIRDTAQIIQQNLDQIQSRVQAIEEEQNYPEDDIDEAIVQRRSNNLQDAQRQNYVDNSQNHEQNLNYSSSHSPNFNINVLSQPNQDRPRDDQVSLNEIEFEEIQRIRPNEIRDIEGGSNGHPFQLQTALRSSLEERKEAFLPVTDDEEIITNGRITTDYFSPLVSIANQHQMPSCSPLERKENGRSSLDQGPNTDINNIIQYRNEEESKNDEAPIDKQVAQTILHEILNEFQSHIDEDIQFIISNVISRK